MFVSLSSSLANTQLWDAFIYGHYNRNNPNISCGSGGVGRGGIVIPPRDI